MASCRLGKIFPVVESQRRSEVRPEPGEWVFRRATSRRRPGRSLAGSSEQPSVPRWSWLGPVFLAFGAATPGVVVRFELGGVTVVFFGGMANPHLRSTTRPRARPVRRTYF